MCQFGPIISPSCLSMGAVAEGPRVIPSPRYSPISPPIATQRISLCKNGVECGSHVSAMSGSTKEEVAEFRGQVEWLSQYVLQHSAENDPQDQRFDGNTPEVNVATPATVSSVNYAEQSNGNGGDNRGCGVVVDIREKASSGSVDNDHQTDNC